MHPDTRVFYHVDDTLQGFQAKVASFGAFPLPTENTILAAELLCRALMETNTPANMGAVCLVELRTQNTMRFVITASGGSSIPPAPVERLRAALQDEIGGTLAVECVTVDTAAVFYAPAHADTTAFVQRAFVPPNAAPGLNELTAAIQAVKQMPDGNFGLSTTGQVVGWLDRHPYGDRAALGENLVALALPGGNPHQYMYRENPNRAVPGHPSFQSAVTRAWTVADLNRFCAEPKAFTFIRTRTLGGGLNGQLALWWDNVRPNRYSTPNPGRRSCPCAGSRTSRFAPGAGRSESSVLHGPRHLPCPAPRAAAVDPWRRQIGPWVAIPHGRVHCPASRPRSRPHLGRGQGVRASDGGAGTRGHTPPGARSFSSAGSCSWRPPWPPAPARSSSSSPPPSASSTTSRT
jgi:hypothetical protein